MHVDSPQVRILVVGASLPVRQRVARSIAAQSTLFSIVHVPSVVEAVREAADGPLSMLIVLEDSPDSSRATQLCLWLRGSRPGLRIPCIVAMPALASGAGQALYAAGADVCIPWTDCLEVDLPRMVRALLHQRSPTTNGVPAPLVELFASGMIARVRGRTVNFTAMQYRIFSYIWLQRPRVVSTEELMSHVRRAMPPGVPGASSTAAVYESISQTRKKLGDERDLVGTVRSFGYRIVDPGRA